MQLEQVLSGLTAEKVKCVYFDNSGNRVVKNNRLLYPLTAISGLEEFNGLYLDVRKTDSWYINISLYELLENKIAYCVSNISQSIEVDRLADALKQYKYFGVNGLIKRLKMQHDNGQYINLLEIELLAMFDFNDLAAEYMAYREDYRTKQDEKRQREEAERVAREQEGKAARQKEIDDQIIAAEQKIINGEKVCNEEIEDSTLLLMLFKKYGIKIPLKTQGWINKVLANVHIDNGSWTYSYYSKLGKNSTVFRDYLLQLIAAVKVAYKVDAAAENEKIQDKQNKQEKIESIAPISFKKSNNFCRDMFDYQVLTKKGTKKIITEQEARVLYLRMFKALKVDDPFLAADNIMFLFDETDTKNTLAAYAGKRSVEVKALTLNGKVYYLFIKTDSKDNKYIAQETA